MDLIEVRLVRLERQNLQLKLGLLTVLLACASVFLMAQTRPTDTITAKRFVLVNSDGTIIATLGSVGLSGAPGLPSMSFFRPGEDIGEINLSIAMSEFGGGGVILVGSSPDYPTARSGIQIRAFDDGKAAFIQGNTLSGSPVWVIP